MRFLSRLFNFRAMLDWDRVTGHLRYLLELIGLLSTPETSQASQTDVTFDDAKNKLDLTDNDLLLKQRVLHRLSLLMLLFALVVFVYAVYQLFYGSPLGCIPSFVVMSIALALAFRYHFWSFQIKERKLGCTVSEWYKRGFKKEL